MSDTFFKNYTDSELDETLKKVINENLGIPLPKIKLNKDLTADYAADSLDIVEIIMKLEEEFNICITEEEAEEANGSIADIRKIVVRRLGKRYKKG